LGNALPRARVIGECLSTGSGGFHGSLSAEIYRRSGQNGFQSAAWANVGRPGVMPPGQLRVSSERPRGQEVFNTGSAVSNRMPHTVSSSGFTGQRLGR
jgi:hypothetical protein